MLDSITVNYLTNFVSSTRNTPFSAAEATALDDLANTVSMDISKDPEIGVMQVSVDTSEDNAALFNTKADSYAKNLAEIVSAQLNLVRTQVKPLVQEMDEAIANAIKEVEDTSAYNRINIVYGQVPDFMLSGRFVSMIEDFKDGDYPAPLGIDMKLEDLSPAYMTSLAVTGIRSIDLDSIPVFEACDPMIMESLITAVYTGRRNRSVIEEYAPANLYDQALYFAYGVLTSYGFMEDVRSETGLSLKEYRGALMAINHYCSKRLCAVLSRIDSEIRSKTLITYFDKIANETHVHKAVYDEYVSTGYRTEAVYGAVISNRPPRLMKQIVDRQDELVREWNNYCSLFEMNKKRKALESVKEVLVYKTEASISENLTDIEKEYMEKVDTHRDKVTSEVRKLAASITYDQMKDTTALAIKAVAGCRFGFTDAEYILSTMHEYMRDDETDPRHAAAIAAAGLLSRFIVKFIKVR